MSDKIMEQLNTMTASLELTVQDWNVLLNILNMPQQVQTVALARFIDLIQSQIGPQIEKSKAALEAVSKTEEEANG
jgi:hypothetical protein